MIYEKDLSDKIISLGFEVHKNLGSGFYESIYKEAMLFELKNNNISFETEKELNIYYKDIILEKKYYADIVVENKIILELKAVEEINKLYISQLINYLKATKLKVGYIINFGNTKLQFKRIVF